MRWAIVIIIFVVLEIYAFQLIRMLSRGHWWKWIYLAVSIGIIINAVLQFSLYPDRTQVVPARNWAVTLLLAFMAAKFIFFLFMFGEDIYRFFEGVFNSLSRKRNNNDNFLHSRRKFIATLGLAVAALPFGALLYGAWRGKFNYQVRSYKLSFDDLPAAFDGYTITQLSDIHVGSFENREEVQSAIDMANGLGSDVIVFTGDLVNNVAREMHGWEGVFSQLNAKDGVYSVLGNHDYGDYVQWESPEKKQENLQELQDIQTGMGWRLLMDEHQTISRGLDKLNIVGVQNWGDGRFPKYGDLEKATAGLDPEAFKVLLSHDPTHWDLQVRDYPSKYHLTLSGHTHGMQFGVEIPGFLKWSPVSFVYKKWAGIYKEADQFLNVNRGFGFIGYSGRAGIWPEITQITLKRSVTQNV
jgi:predicted MPP superfamily phosphohydrolase